MPYGTVNLRHGVPEGETPVTCTAGVGTFVVEFGALSRLTGDPVYEDTAMRAMHALWHHRSTIDLVDNHIDVVKGKWTAIEAGRGRGGQLLGVPGEGRHAAAAARAHEYVQSGARR